jgi:hypothetical protein
MSTSEESLGEIMSGTGGLWKEPPAKVSTGETTAPPAVTEPPKADVKPVEGKTDATRDESGRFKKAEGETPAEKPLETKPRADVAAIIDERRKRQEADKRYADLLASIQKPAEKPSVFDNEDAAISSRVAEANQPIRETIYKLSLKTARAVYKDFGEAEQAFADALEKDDGRLLQGLRASDDPGEFIYTMGIHVRELADVGGDLMKYREKVTGSMKGEIETRDARIKALEAELAAAKELNSDLDNVPRSLNNTSSGASPKAGEEDPEDLKSIVRFGNKSR